MGAMGGMGTTAMRNALLGRGGAGQQHIRAIAGGSRWRPAGGSQAVTDKPGPLLVKPAEGPARVSLIPAFAVPCTSGGFLLYQTLPAP